MKEQEVTFAVLNNAFKKTAEATNMSCHGGFFKKIRYFFRKIKSYFTGKKTSTAGCYLPSVKPMGQNRQGKHYHIDIEHM